MRKKVFIIRFRMARSTIGGNGYAQKRMSEMNANMCAWKDRRAFARTNAEKALCDKMCAMYLRRYQWYLSR